ncbi:DUF4352 domain-containing protein [Velocimicrobium porci]|uniref:DUF4352 domain-containing protein n=1 Tax=Velocimicrobium porci TaxID=2606634 RepID=A0A6L5XYF3_9FIRM|nr:DUF4352 domain-containing protein [Velocimicrobium porci]MSS63792.1 DUF4352 domain-containing protein [Velocimicrobium porci]
MKKRYISCAILLSACLLTGCGSGIELTDEENNMVAEYMAGALLKYDHGYKEALIETDIADQEDIGNENEQNSIVSKDEKEMSNDINQNQSSDTLNSEDKKDISKENTEKSYSLEELFEKKDYSLNYKNSELCSSYPEKENGYFIVEATAGKKLAVINLTVRNISGKTKNINLSNQGIGYSLAINGKVYDKPLLTAIMNDVQYFSDTITAGKSKKAVLVFEVDKKVKLSDGTLSISVDDKTVNVKLK